MVLIFLKYQLFAKIKDIKKVFFCNKYGKNKNDLFSYI